MLTGRWALVAGAVLVVALGCAPRGRSPMPATDPADFMRTGLDVEGNRQRLYIGYAGNGVFLGPGGDAASRPARALGAQSPVAFGDFWQKRSRGALLSLSLTPGPAAADAYWQVLDIDTGQATTCWSFRRSPVSRGECRVESVVTPEGVICWQVRSAGRRMRLSVAVPAVRPEAWEMGGGVATARVKGAAGEGVISLRVAPTPKWRFQKTGHGEGRRYLLEADLAGQAFIALEQRILAGGAFSRPRLLDFPATFAEARQASREAWSRYWARSSVSLPDPELMKWYRRSLYYLGAMAAGSRFPPGPMGPHPNRWGGRIFGHDATYMHGALLTSNHAAESGRFVAWYLETLEAARRMAREGYGLPGARYGWEQNWRGEECAPKPLRYQHHVNADIAWQAWRQAEWTADEGLAGRIRPLLRDTGAFLAAQLRWDTAVGGFVSPQSCDLDEEAPEVAGAIATQTSAAWLAEVCCENGAATEAIKKIRGRVYLPEASAAAGSVLTGYVGDSVARPMKHPSPVLPIWWLGVVDADSELARRSFDSALSRVDLDRTPTFNRAWLAATAAHMHDGDRAAALLRDLLGGSSVVDDTCFAETQGSPWTHFLTTSGALVAAVNEMLLQCPERGLIEVFPALPRKWMAQGTSFGTLLARGGLLVSAELRAGEVVVTLSGTHAGDPVVLDLPAVGGGIGSLIAELDGDRAAVERAARGRVRIHLPAASRPLRRVRVTPAAG